MRLDAAAKSPSAFCTHSLRTSIIKNLPAIDRVANEWVILPVSLAKFLGPIQQQIDRERRIRFAENFQSLRQLPAAVGHDDDEVDVGVPLRPSVRARAEQDDLVWLEVPDDAVGHFEDLPPRYHVVIVASRPDRR